jgi:FkbM family methyltransferase
VNDVVSELTPAWVETTDTRYGRVHFPSNDVVLGEAVKAYGEWFEAEVDVFRAFIKEGDTVVDVGANFGMHTLALGSLVGKPGKVYAIEPQPELAALVKENAVGVKVYCAFAGAEPGKVLAIRPNYRKPGSFGSYSMSQYTGAAAQGKGDHYAPVISFDKTLHWLNPSFLKIDCEGEELSVLRGAKRLIARTRPVMYIENDRPGSSPPLVQFLMDLDYRLFWHLAPFFNPNNYRGNKELVPIHRLGYAFMYGQFWFNGVALMMLALPREKSELIPKIPPGLIEVGLFNEHPCSNEDSVQASAELAGLGRLPCLQDDRGVKESTKLAMKARKLTFEGNLDPAKELFKSALELDHDDMNVWSHMGVLQGPGRYDATIACYKRALALTLKAVPAAPKAAIADLCQNIGTNLMRAERYAEVLPFYEKALEIKEGVPDASLLHNWGLLDYNLNSPFEAVKKLEAALAFDTSNIWIKSDLAHAVLKTGDLTRGLKLMDVRWEMPRASFPKSSLWKIGIPQWTGEPIPACANLLIHHEQGNGDTFQFIRYLPRIQEHSGAGRILFAGPRKLKSLLQSQGHLGITEDDYFVWDDAEDLVKVARLAYAHSPLVTAVGYTNPSYETIPFAKGYINAPYKKDDVDLHHGGAKFAIGLVWSPALEVDRGLQRVVPLGQYMPLAEIPGVRLWSLQLGLRTPDALKYGCDLIVSDATVYVEDGQWADTAALIDQLDAVVTVDTAVAHLAGAMGKTTLMLDPYVPCWRWRFGGKPWYASMELFHQTKAGTYEWQEPIAGIVKRVQELVGGT